MLTGFPDEKGDAFGADVYFGGNYWDYMENGKTKMGREGLDKMKSIIERMRSNEDDRKSIPTLPSNIQNVVNGLLSANPNIKVTIIN